MIEHLEVIQFDDVRVGDRLRVEQIERGMEHASTFVVSEIGDRVLRCAGGSAVCVYGSAVITLLDRPTPPSLVDRMLAATYEDSRCKPDIVEIRGMKRALAVVRADIAALHDSGDPQGWAPYRDQTFDEILAHLTPEETP